MSVIISAWPVLLMMMDNFMPNSRWVKWRRRRGLIVVVLLVYFFLSADLSPITIARANLLGERICRMAESGAFDHVAETYEILDLRPVGPRLTRTLNLFSESLKNGCDYDFDILRQDFGDQWMKPNVLSLKGPLNPANNGPQNSNLPPLTENVTINIVITNSLIGSVFACLLYPTECSLGLWPGSVSSSPYPDR